MLLGLQLRLVLSLVTARTANLRTTIEALVADVDALTAKLAAKGLFVVVGA